VRDVIQEFRTRQRVSFFCKLDLERRAVCHAEGAVFKEQIVVVLKQVEPGMPVLSMPEALNRWPLRPTVPDPTAIPGVQGPDSDDPGGYPA
jgi:hypothetical protein